MKSFLSKSNPCWLEIYLFSKDSSHKSEFFFPHFLFDWKYVFIWIYISLVYRWSDGHIMFRLPVYLLNLILFFVCTFILLLLDTLSAAFILQGHFCNINYLMMDFLLVSFFFLILFPFSHVGTMKMISLFVGFVMLFWNLSPFGLPIKLLVNIMR